MNGQLGGAGGRPTETPEGASGVRREHQALRGPVPASDDHDHDHERDTDHLALVYEDRDEQFATVATFLRRGLERGEQCVYVADDNSRDALLAALRERGVDVDAALESDALAVLTPAETYRRTGEFDREAMLDFWRKSLAEARSGGFDGVRAAAEMTWALECETSMDHLVEYEALLNPLYEDDDYTVLCQYNRNRFPDDVVHDVIKTHPFVVQNGTVSRNVYYTPPEKFFGTEPPEDKVDRKLGTLRERTESKTTLRDHERDLHDLHEIVADTDRDFDEKVRDVLDLGCERFDMDMGGLARVDPEIDRFEVEVTNGDHDELVPGSEYPLSETYCRVTAREGDTVAVTDTAGFEGDLCYDQFGIRAYLGTYLELDDTDDRTLWFVSRRPRDEISPGDEGFHHLMGQWVQYELEQQRRVEQLAALDSINETARDINRALAEQSTREEVEETVCDRLAGSDSYAFACIGTLEDGDVVPTTVGGARRSQAGPLEGVAGDLAERTARTDTTRVARDVDPGDAAGRWRERVDEGGTVAVAAVPVAYEDEHYGVLTVYTTRDGAFDEKERDVVATLGEIMGLAIVAIRHERELAHERERLEFFNRLVRHNLLNSLNVVRARAEILDDYVDQEATDHMETVRDRTEDMIDLIESLRSLMREVVETGEHELEAVDLGAVLEAEVEQARRTFEDATFSVRDDLEDVGEVFADDLVEEVFENLLVNAVRHNDKPTPRVTVAVDSGEEALTVRVADNGPGMPDDLRDRIFDEGVKGFDSPGTGFGLHLVREVVDAYGGTVTIEDRDPEGTVVAVSLPRSTSR